MLYKAFISYSHAADARLAPALRSALRRIGAPWYRPAPFRIFLDESSMAANPALWSSIEAALAQSEYLLLLASTTSAHSEWVERELDWWLTHRSPETILILVTDGEVEWTTGATDFDWDRSTALNRRLVGAFREEPLWVDLRWTRTDKGYSLRHERFRDAILQIAPPLYGKSREDLDDEDTRRYRLARRLAAAGVVSVAGLILAVTIAARAARTRQELADCRKLAGRAVTFLDSQLDLALLLSVEDSQRSCVEGRSVLLSALQHNPHLAGFLPGHTDTVTSVAFAPDGKKVASSSWDHSLRLWDVEKRKTILPVLKGMYGLSFSPDGAHLASADGESVTLWNVAGGNPAGKLQFDRGYSVIRAAFSPDGKAIATSNDPNGVTPAQLLLWDPTTRQRLGPALPAQTFAFRPDGKVLASEGEDGKSIVLTDIGTRRQIGAPLVGHTARIRSIAFSVDGQMLAAGAEDNAVALWDLGEGRTAATLLNGHHAPVNTIAFNPELKLLASGSGDGTIVLWDLEQMRAIGMPLRISNRPVFDLAFSPDGRMLISTSGNYVVVWNLFDDFPLGREVRMENQQESGLAFSSDGKTLASIDTYGDVTLTDADTGRVRSDSIGNRVTSVAFQPGGSQFASVTWDGKLELWDSTTGEPKGNAQQTGFRLWSVAFSPDGRTIAIGGDSALLLWSVNERRWISRVSGKQKDRIWSVAFSPDGKLLASGGNTTVGLWDAKSGAALVDPFSLDPKSEYLVHSDVTFSRDGKLLAFRKSDSGVAIWDASNRKQVGEVLKTQIQVVSSLAFSPDGTTIFAGGDRGVELWDARTRQPIGQLAATDGEVASLAFTPNGKSLATLAEKRLVIWDVDQNSWRERACRLANRNLTPDEWSRFLGPGLPYRAICAAQAAPQ